MNIVGNLCIIAGVRSKADGGMGGVKRIIHMDRVTLAY